MTTTIPARSGAPPTEESTPPAIPLIPNSNSNSNSIPLQFNSRRSPVLCKHGCVASSQPLASEIGLQILRKGGNAADAAIAVAGALCVTEPCSTGLGGDAFALFYDATSRRISALNGSGKSPASLTYEAARTAAARTDLPWERNALSVTVPGAARAWDDFIQKHGSGTLTLSELLEPAAILAEDGFPVGPITAYHWSEGAQTMLYAHAQPGEHPLAIQPTVGQLVKNPDLAQVLRELGQDGPDAFYSGRIGQAIVDAVQSRGGCLTLDDLTSHTSTYPDPISTEYRGYRLWEIPPNGQGVAALIALSSLQALEQTATIPPITPNSIGTAPTYHALIETMRLGFADARAYVSDPESCPPSSVEKLLDPSRIASRVTQLFDPHRAAIHGHPDSSSCTVSFQVVDGHGNAVSFVNSNFHGFGTGIVPHKCGFSLQNRGCGFTLNDNPTHPNAAGPSKRPYHTIIPALLTHQDTDELYATLTNMGGNMQVCANRKTNTVVPGTVVFFSQLESTHPHSLHFLPFSIRQKQITLSPKDICSSQWPCWQDNSTHKRQLICLAFAYPTERRPVR